MIQRDAPDGGRPSRDEEQPRGPVADLVDRWRDARRELAAIERAEHPPITDALGRSWEWIPGGSGDLYGHDGMAWPRHLVERPDVGLPTPGALDNPNYRWCELCRSPSVRLAGGRRVPVTTVVDPQGRV